jgi:glycosyltransferase involved in cell wall biosynthesis
VDVVHAHWLLPQGLIAAILRGRRMQGLPFVVTSHGADLYALRGKWLDYLKRTVVLRSSAATVVSLAMRDELERIDVDTGKVSVHPMGVDLESRFAPSEREQRSSNEILFVGRLVEKKGVRHLIDAMPFVLTAKSDARLVIVGFGPEESALRDQVRQLGLDAHTTFAGAVGQAQLPLMYRHAAVLAAPFVQAASGDREGLGLVTVEALGCGCPVVTTDIPATLDVMPSAPGFVRVAAGDAKALAEALVDVLENAQRHRAGALSCREELLRRLDWSVVAREYRCILLHAAGR